MNVCPGCGQKTLSFFSSLEAYSQKCTKCPNCGATVRRKMRLSDFLVPIYLLGGIGAERFFHVDIDNNVGLYLAIAFGVLAIQLRLVKYEIK